MKERDGAADERKRNSDSMISTRGLVKSFPLSGGNSITVLKNIEIEVPQGRLTILKGRSGSGKTTLMNILSALDMPTEGEVFFDGKEVTTMSESEREKLRRYHMGYIFQAVALVPVMNVYENVEFSLRLAGFGEGTKDKEQKRQERVEECLKRVGLLKRMHHMPEELSGGEQQRVAIARALAHRPKVVFADEPTGALDTDNGLLVVKLFKELVEQEGVTIVMTTHDPSLMELGDVVFEIEDGEIIGRKNDCL